MWEDSLTVDCRHFPEIHECVTFTSLIVQIRKEKSSSEQN